MATRPTCTSSKSLMLAMTSPRSSSAGGVCVALLSEGAVSRLSASSALEVGVSVVSDKELFSGVGPL